MDPAELCARIHAIVRRSRGFNQAQLQIGDLTVDLNRQTVVASGVSVHFTVKEFAILELLVLRRNMVLTKETILDQIYGGMDAPEIKIIDVFICKIRGKLSKAGLPTVISTVWVRGYSVKDVGGEMPVSSPVRPQPVRAERAFA